jgi:hypothetical protein
MTEQLLKKNFVYQLMRRCEDPEYESIVREIFDVRVIVIARRAYPSIDNLPCDSLQLMVALS